MLYQKHISYEGHTMKKIFIILFIAGGLLLSNSLMAANIFLDGFESEDLSTTNADGFSWANPNRTSLVTMDPDANQGVCEGSETGAYAIWNNGDICNFGGDGKDWTAKNGDISMRFRYPADEPWAEQRFEMGEAYPELWMAFWLRVPTNFHKGDGSNNKFWRIWRNDYSESKCKVGSEFRTAGNQYPDGSANVYLKAPANTGDAAHYSPFMRPEDAGRWMHIVVYMKCSSEVDSGDGIVRQWRKWESDSDYILMNEVTNRNIQPEGPKGSQGFNKGYIMGWANDPYSETTEFLIDDFELSTSDLRQNQNLSLYPPSNIEIEFN